MNGQKYYEVQALDQDSRYIDGSRVVLDRCVHRHRSERTAELCQQNLISGGLAPGEWRQFWRCSRIAEID